MSPWRVTKIPAWRTTRRPFQASCGPLLLVPPASTALALLVSMLAATML